MPAPIEPKKVCFLLFIEKFGLQEAFTALGGGYASYLPATVDYWKRTSSFFIQLNSSSICYNFLSLLISVRESSNVAESYPNTPASSQSISLIILTICCFFAVLAFSYFAMMNGQLFAILLARLSSSVSAITCLFQILIISSFDLVESLTSN